MNTCTNDAVHWNDVCENPRECRACHLTRTTEKSNSAQGLARWGMLRWAVLTGVPAAAVVVVVLVQFLLMPARRFATPPLVKSLSSWSVFSAPAPVAPDPQALEKDLPSPRVLREPLVPHPNIWVKPLSRYFAHRWSAMKETLGAALARVGAEQLFAGRDCRVLMTSHNDIPADWLNRESPTAEGDCAQAADLFLALRGLGCTVHVAVLGGKTPLPLSDVEQYDAIFTGYLGIYEFAEKPGLSPVLRNRTFLIDIYGTSEYFLTKGVMPFCCTFLEGNHVLTMFPNIAPGNGFLGLVVATPEVCRIPEGRGKKEPPFGLVWGKSAEQIDVDTVVQLSREMPLVITGAPIAGLHGLANVTFVGRLAKDDFFRTMQQATLLVSAGGHYLGFAPIQALNCGTAYLQPSWTRAHAERFVRGKPTSQVPTSPMPWLEHDYRSPLVRTVDFKDAVTLRRAIGELVTAVANAREQLPKPVLEFSADAFVERVVRLMRPLILKTGENEEAAR
jgi:hypothetical protein